MKKLYQVNFFIKQNFCFCLKWKVVVLGWKITGIPCKYSLLPWYCSLALNLMKLARWQALSCIRTWSELHVLVFQTLGSRPLGNISSQKTIAIFGGFSDSISVLVRGILLYLWKWLCNVLLWLDYLTLNCFKIWFIVLSGFSSTYSSRSWILSSGFFKMASRPIS